MQRKQLVLIFVLLLTVTTGLSEAQTAKREYYPSQVGLWYTVWWDSLERDPVYFKHHWGTNTRVKPIKHGYYATDDPEKLKDDFQFFHRIGIDYLILDDTNAHYNDGGNIARHIDACFAMARELGTNAPKICFAGGRPLIDGDVNGMQAELDIFADYAEKYRDNTFFWKGKPLFVNFNIAKNYSYQDKQNRFTMRPATGHLLEGFHAYKEHNLDKTGMYGWVFDMQYETSEVYGITPGFSRSHNNLGTTLAPISRENGERYRREWLNAVKRKPEMIVISSWNDHAEETGIEAVELLSPIPGRGEEDPFFYEKITEGYLALKTGYLENWYYRSESDSQVYQYRSGKLHKVSRLDEKEIVIVVPDDYFDWAGVPKA
ncbi:MAG: hypothetical protein FWC43_07090 [Planctomycetaceae bacterium]|nr:hypothetical protein [Planctomycetaceae bacterium]MCL2305093.1 hypothetical protein [Planctomycetaceae bacterium]